MTLTQFPFWKISNPDATQHGRNKNLAVIEEGVRQEAGPGAQISAAEMRPDHGPAAPFTWGGLWNDIFNTDLSVRSATTGQLVRVNSSIGTRSLEMTFTVAQAFGAWRITTIDFFTALAKPVAGKVKVKKQVLKGYRFVADNSEMAEHLNQDSHLRNLVRRNLRKSYKFARLRVNVAPWLVLVPHDQRALLGVRTTIRELWWTYGLVKNVGIAPFLELSSELERTL